jgi:hypothetical protein
MAETRTRTDVLACSTRSPAGDAAAVASAPGAAAGAGARVMARQTGGEAEGKKEIKVGVEQSRPRPPLPTARIAAGARGRGGWAYMGLKEPKVGRGLAVGLVKARR